MPYDLEAEERGRDCDTDRLKWERLEFTLSWRERQGLQRDVIQRAKFKPALEAAVSKGCELLCKAKTESLGRVESLKTLAVVEQQTSHVGWREM